MSDKKGNITCPLSGTAYSGIGGQAVMEGVMMRNREDYAVAVRRSNGEIVVKKDKYKGIVKGDTINKIPVLRGVFAFIDSLVLGLSTLNFSSDIYMQDIEEEEKKEKEKEKAASGSRDDDENGSEESKDGAAGGETDSEESKEGADGNKDKGGMSTFMNTLIMIVAIILALGLFMVLPYFASLLFKGIVGEGILLSLIEGVIRIIIFIGYIKAISLMEDIKRTFMYHGAEHKCINCLEAGYELTVENVRKASREHRRCGTSFLLYVMVISIIFFSFIQTDVKILKVVLRLVLIPVIAGVSYEFIRLAGKSDNPVIKAFSKPGLMMQKLTTREPDDEMIEVGIRSVEEVFDWRAFLKENFGR